MRMDFRRPFTLITPTLDGDVLATLAAAEVEFSGRELARRAQHGSTEGIRRAADRLAAEGIVARRSVAGAHLYSLNREHIAAPWIEAVATLPEQLISRLRSMIDGWDEPASLAFLFGSAAREEASSASDLDLLVVRRRACDPESDPWRSQLVALEQEATALTGNDARVLELGEGEIRDGQVKGVLEDVLRDGVAIRGSKRDLQRLLEPTQRDESLPRI
jgi:predicted nucleotidyltransferase